MRTIRPLAIAALLLLSIAAAQGLDLTVNDVGLAIGNKPCVTGLRINFRDSGLDYVKGINTTVWTPYEPMSGTVSGLALGLPATGAARIRGLALAPIGVGAARDISGIGVGGIGVGAPALEGIVIGGAGAGA